MDFVLVFIICAIVLNGLPTAALRKNESKRRKTLERSIEFILPHHRQHRHNHNRHCPVCKHLACADKDNPHFFFKKNAIALVPRRLPVLNEKYKL